MAAKPYVIENFTLYESAATQSEHDVWRKVICAQETGGETNLLSMPVPFSQFFFSEDEVLGRNQAHKNESVAQFVITECYMLDVLQLVHVIAGTPGVHPYDGQQKKNWPTMRIDSDKHVSKCV